MFAHRLLELHASYGGGIGSAALSQCYRLQVLDATSNHKIDTLRPFAAQLRELVACSGSVLGDVALAEATQLVKLNACDNSTVTTVAPFSNTLIELRAGCGITDAGLVTATNLVCLQADQSIQSVAPFALTLLELDLELSSMIGDS